MLSEVDSFDDDVFYLVSRWLAGVEESQKTDVHYRYSDVVRFSDRFRTFDNTRRYKTLY